MEMFYFLYFFVPPFFFFPNAFFSQEANKLMKQDNEPDHTVLQEDISSWSKGMLRQTILTLFSDPEFSKAVYRDARNDPAAAKADKQITIKMLCCWCRENIEVRCGHRLWSE